jgi:hypothetical protein
LFPYSGEAKNLGALAYPVKYDPKPADVNFIAAQNILRELYDYWYYLRIAAVLLAILAMRAVVNLVKSGSDKTQPGSLGSGQISPSGD